MVIKFDTRCVRSAVLAVASIAVLATSTDPVYAQLGTNVSKPADLPGSENNQVVLGNYASTISNIFGGGRGGGGFGGSLFASMDGTQTTALAGGMRSRYQSSGDGFAYPFGLWASYTHSRFEDEFVGSAIDGDSDSIFIGADFSPFDDFVFGVTFGYDTTDVDTIVNGGEQELDSYTVAPYMAANLAEAVGVGFDLSMDMAVGYSSVDIDQFRTAGGARVTSSTSSDRFFWTANVNAGQQFGNWYVSGSGGLLFANDQVDGFTESNGNVVGDNRTELGRATAGGGVSYLWGNFEPYVNAFLQHDYDLEPNLAAGHPNDKTDVRVGVGLRYYGESWSGRIGYNRTLGRDDFEEDAISLTIRGEF